jgi:hypothetical protein
LNLSAFPAADNREDQVTVPESALNSLAAALASGHFDHNRAYRQEAWRCEASTHQRLDETVDRIKKGSFNWTTSYSFRHLTASQQSFGSRQSLLDSIVVEAEKSRLTACRAMRELERDDAGRTSSK